MAKASDSTGVLEVDHRLQNIIAQEGRRQEALQSLASLRKDAATEIDRLIAFLDASDEYVTTELESTDDPTDEECRVAGQMASQAHWSEDAEPSLGWTEREAAKGRYGSISDAELDTADAEPSLGAIERHPSIYQAEGRSSIGHQLDWAEGNRDDTEDEHDGAEPDDEGDDNPDDEPSLGWTEAGEHGASHDGEVEAKPEPARLEASRDRHAASFSNLRMLDGSRATTEAIEAAGGSERI